MEWRREQRVASAIQKELALVIQRELADPRLAGLPSITRVKVSPDLANADVYVTVMGTPGHQAAALNALRHSAGLMRTRLTKALTMRQVPFLRFHLDEDLKKELEVMELLRKVEEELKARPGGAAGPEAKGGEATGGEAKGEEQGEG